MDIKDLKPVKGGLSPEVDIKQYHNQLVEIELMEVLKVPSTYTSKGPDGLNFPQHVLKVSSKPLATFGEGDDKIEIRASELFNLIQDSKTGELIGYPTTKDANLVKFMADVGATVPTDLVGKKATIKAYEKKYENSTRTFLKFKF